MNSFILFLLYGSQKQPLLESPAESLPPATEQSQAFYWDDTWDPPIGTVQLLINLKH